jgi:hypothetical protein
VQTSRQISQARSGTPIKDSGGVVVRVQY